MSHHSGNHGSHTPGHTIPTWIYGAILGALLVLTVLTVALAKMPMFNLGHWNVVVAMLVASSKAMLVVLFFMHLKYENPITWLYAAFPIVLLFILIGGLFLDNPFRGNPSDGIGWAKPIVIQYPDSGYKPEAEEK